MTTATFLVLLASITAFVLTFCIGTSMGFEDGRAHMLKRLGEMSDDEIQQLVEEERARKRKRDDKPT